MVLAVTSLPILANLYPSIEQVGYSLKSAAPNLARRQLGMADRVDEGSPNHMTHAYCFFLCHPFALSSRGIHDYLIDTRKC